MKMDFLGMMKQAKVLQEKMQSLQSEIAALYAGGGDAIEEGPCATAGASC